MIDYFRILVPVLLYMNKIQSHKTLLALKKGDKDAFALIYLDFFDKLSKYVYTLSDDEHLAQDIAQDVLMTLWHRRKVLFIKTSLNAYLYKNAYHNFTDYYKKKKREKSLVTTLQIEAIQELEMENESVYSSEKLKLLLEIIDRLPEKRKEIFILHKLRNYHHKEIAEMLNISVRTVENQISRALASIRKEIANNSSKSELLSLFVTIFLDP